MIVLCLIFYNYYYCYYYFFLQIVIMFRVNIYFYCEYCSVIASGNEKCQFH